jgi:hypothetical protein
MVCGAGLYCALLRFLEKETVQIVKRVRPSPVTGETPRDLGSSFCSAAGFPIAIPEGRNGA